MSILRILFGLLAAFIAFPAFANDIQVGRGVICDTKEQAERYVALFKDNAVEALTRVNAEAKTDHAAVWPPSPISLAQSAPPPETKKAKLSGC